jgi:TonB family protein
MIARSVIILIAFVTYVCSFGCSMLSNGAPTAFTSKPPEPNIVYSEEQVDEPPVLIEAPEPIYPRLAEQAGLEGDVVVSIVVTSSGRVCSAEVIQSSTIPSLDESALASAYQFKYTPARIGEITVACRTTEIIEFRLTQK